MNNARARRNVWKLGGTTTALAWGALVIYPDTWLFMGVMFSGIAALVLYTLVTTLNQNGD